jgi:hypothetical protein
MTAAATAATVGIAVVLVLDAPAEIGHQYDRFVNSPGATGGDLRTRLTDPANNGRIDAWDVAVDAFGDKPLAGTGAGTYQNVWAANRPVRFFVRDAHSLYVEVLGELGIVGLGLLAAALLAILVTLGLRARAANRTLYAALLAASLTWALHAGIDWDWEMPTVTGWVFALGGGALAASGRQSRRPRPPRPTIRIAAVTACFAIAIVPGLVLVSQSRLEDAANAFQGGNCRAATDDASSSITALGNRSQPYEIRAFCRIREGSPQRGVEDLQKAVEHDPDNWAYHYELALALGAVGLDPQGEARKAVQLNPLSPDAQAIAKSMRGRSPAVRKRKARALLRLASPFYLSER